MKDLDIDAVITAALQEDMPCGDITSENVIAAESASQAVLLAKEEGVLAGIKVAERVFQMLDPGVSYSAHFSDGDAIASGDRLASIQGNSVSLLKGERTALNFLQRLSGIATLTRRYVLALNGTPTRLLDTRKTTPGLRRLEKYAVRMGGGQNHRLSLSDMVMLKDNHIRLVGSIKQAVSRARRRIDSGIRIEVETTSLEQVREAVESGADMIMLDNMSREEMREAVHWVGGRVPLEVSGNVDLSNIRKIAELGVDYVSVGRLTHSFESLDISLEFS
jgi:nicotinate-nucleotide pyrophosphorylase (carboxylating)